MGSSALAAAVDKQIIAMVMVLSSRMAISRLLMVNVCETSINGR
jgi:ABC-type taurine transport system substrate-binding protein